MKLLKIIFGLEILLLCSLFAGQNDDVNGKDIAVWITKDTPYLYTYHKGQKIKVGRIQDSDNRLSDDYAKTSRACPPFCIHPTNVTKDVQTIGEVELIDFMKKKVSTVKGVIIDARLKSWFELETIPSAVNIPYPIMESGNKKVIEKVFKILGMRLDSKGKWDFSKAKELVAFDNGVWCDQSTRLIKGMIKNGYPAKKIFSYRDGFQGWKLLGLTTVIQKENKK
jgi:hypothetical protein